MVEPKDLDHAARVARVTGSQGIRNAAILLSLFGTGLTPSELAALRVADAVRENGEMASKQSCRRMSPTTATSAPFFGPTPNSDLEWMTI